MSKFYIEVQLNEKKLRKFNLNQATLGFFSEILVTIKSKRFKLHQEILITPTIEFAETFEDMNDAIEVVRTLTAINKHFVYSIKTVKEK